MRKVGSFVFTTRTCHYSGLPFMSKLKDPTSNRVWRPELLLAKKIYT